MKWIPLKNQFPPKAKKVLVVKHFLNQKFSEKKGYYGKSFPTPSFVDLDTTYDGIFWGKGGFVTHWLPIPEIPKVES